MLALDAAMGIFNNVPARVNYCELDLQLSCHPGTFELANHLEMLQQAALPRPRMKLVEAFRRLFVPPSELRIAYQHEEVCCWDLLSLIHGTCVEVASVWIFEDAYRDTVMFTHCWQNLFENPLYRNSPTSLTHDVHLVHEPMKVALKNWKTLWDDVRAKLPRSAVGEMGFETSADSYWTLTSMIVQKFERKNRTNSTGGSSNGVTSQPTGHTTVKRDTVASDDGMSESSANSRARGISPVLDFMPLEADSDSQGAHLRKILAR